MSMPEKNLKLVKPQLSTEVSYPERGKYGDNRWRGNCSGKMIQDLFVGVNPVRRSILQTLQLCKDFVSNGRGRWILSS